MLHWRNPSFFDPLENPDSIQLRYYNPIHLQIRILHKNKRIRRYLILTPTPSSFPQTLPTTCSPESTPRSSEDRQVVFQRPKNPSTVHQKMKKISKKSIQTLINIHGITPKRVTSGGVHFHGLAPARGSSEETWQRCRAVDDTYAAVIKVSRPVSVSRPIFSGLGLEHIFVVLVSRCCGLGLVRSKLVSRPACFLIHHANLLAVF